MTISKELLELIRLSNRYLVVKALSSRNAAAGCMVVFAVAIGRTADAPPGTTVVWRGFSRLADLVEGARISRDLS